jgi:hypothetical protein
LNVIEVKDIVSKINKSGGLQKAAEREREREEHREIE